MAKDTTDAEVAPPRRRRARGQGSVYRRGDGRWVGRLSRHGVRKSYYGRTRDEAEQQLRIARNIATDYGTIPDLTASVTAVIDDYRERRYRPHAKKVPPAAVADHLAIIEERLGHRRVAFLTVNDIRDDFFAPLALDLDDNTFAEVRHTLIHVLDHATHGWADHNPAKYNLALPEWKRRL